MCNGLLTLVNPQNSFTLSTGWDGILRKKAVCDHWLLSGSSYLGRRNKSRVCSSKVTHLACCLALSTSEIHRLPALPKHLSVPPLLQYKMQHKPEKTVKCQAPQIIREVVWNKVVLKGLRILYVVDCNKKQHSKRRKMKCVEEKQM